MLTTDRQSEATGLWGFQAKCTKQFTEADLTKVLSELQSFPGALAHYVVVTTAPPDVRVQDHARAQDEARGIAIAVWGWEEFSDHIFAACGSGSWLSAAQRRCRRAEWLAEVIRTSERRSSLGPLQDLIAPVIPVEEVWVEPDIRIVDKGGASPTFTANPRDWFATPDLLRTVLVGGSAGSGKTSFLWHYVLEQARIASGDPEAPLPVFIKASRIAEHGRHEISRALTAELPGALWMAVDRGRGWARRGGSGCLGALLAGDPDVAGDPHGLRSRRGMP